MSGTTERNEKRDALLDAMGDVDESYIREYMEARLQTARRRRRPKIRFTIALAAALGMLFGMASLAAVPAIGHFLTNLAHEQDVIVQNFDKIQSEYALPIGDAQECEGLTGTLNSAVLEEDHLLLSYTFNWSGLEEARDGSFHTYFLPWFFYITEGDHVICQSEYTKSLHTQQLNSGSAEEDPMEVTLLYCIDLESVKGQDLVGRELNVRLLYARDGEGFSGSFTPKACFPGREWEIGRTYEFQGHSIRLDRIRESALYVTLFIDCDTIGHLGDAYAFLLSDELGNDYSVYPDTDRDTGGYWFTKPAAMNGRLVLKVIRSHKKSDSHGKVLDDSYEVLYEIPIELDRSLWERLFG